jgi:hypothetical protein
VAPSEKNVIGLTGARIADLHGACFDWDTSQRIVDCVTIASSPANAGRRNSSSLEEMTRAGVGALWRSTLDSGIAGMSHLAASCEFQPQVPEDDLCCISPRRH